MGRKAATTKDKKVKTAARSGKGSSKAKPLASHKRTDKPKSAEKTTKERSSQPAVTKPSASSAKMAKGSPKDKQAPSVKLVKIDKAEKKQSAVATVAKTEPRNNSPKANNKAVTKGAAPSGKIIVKPLDRSRQPREIGGLPKAPAFRGPFDRSQRVDDRSWVDSEPAGGNGDSHDENGSDATASTYLTDAELEEFRQLLTVKRQEIVRDVTNLEDEAIRQASGGGTSSSMPIHMADLGTDTWEQELTLGLIENERNLLREIDEALERVNNKTYGICLATNKRISKTRLQAKPWAKYCIEYARKRELGLA